MNRAECQDCGHVAGPPCKDCARAMAAKIKPTNPKDLIGVKKAGLSWSPKQALYEVSLAQMWGGIKYGRASWRDEGVLATVYLDAMRRHLDDFEEGQDLDPESQLSHIAHVGAGCLILLDSMLTGNWKDDRPIATDPEWLDRVNEKAKRLLERARELGIKPVEPFTQARKEAEA